jgi:polar amino acid transport system substrate-binding protein
MDRRQLVSSAAAAAAGLVLARTATAQPQSAVEASNFNRIRNAGALRVAVMRGQEPYYHKDIAAESWSGACVDMANDIARVMRVNAELVETANWNTNVLDLQSGKVDLIFGVSPTPERALVFDLPSPVFMNFYTVVGRKGFPRVARWEELNKPQITVAVDLGSGQEAIAKRVLPKATIRSFRDHDEMLLGLSTGKHDCCLLAILLAMKAVSKVPTLGDYSVPRPFLAAASCMAVRIDSDKRFRDFLSAWATYNRSTGMIREWVGKALSAMGIDPSTIPPEVEI